MRSWLWRRRWAFDYLPPRASAAAVSRAVSIDSCRETALSGGGDPLRIAVSNSDTRLRRSLIAPRTVSHDCCEQRHSVWAFAISDSTPLRKSDHAAMSYGGLAKRCSPLPQISEACWAVEVHELSGEEVAAAEPCRCCFAHGNAYFQATIASTMTMIHFVRRFVSIRRSYACVAMSADASRRRGGRRGGASALALLQHLKLLLQIQHQHQENDQEKEPE